MTREQTTNQQDGLARVPADLHRETRIQAARMGITVREAVSRALRAWLARQRRKAA